MYGEKTFKNLYKIIKESISCNVANLFYSKSTQRALGHLKGTQGTLIGHLINWGALKGHSKCTWALKSLRHSTTWDTQALEVPWALGHSRHPRHLDTKDARYLDFQELRHLGAWALEGHLGTQVLKILEYLDTRDTRGTLFSTLL